jgi:hypothetical protein
MNKVKFSIFGLSVLVLSVTFHSCKKDNISSGSIISNGAVSVTSVILSKFTSAVTISTSGSGISSGITLKSNGLPDHKTPYWGSGNALYEPFPSGHAPNVNTEMIAQNYAMTIPTNPNEASSKEATSLGEIGMTLNGVAIFNDREGGNISLDAMTLTTFDYSGAHPAPGKNYHYHTTGRYTSVDDAKLIGFLRDGFPIYGRKDTTGAYPTLDTYGGHTGPTQDFPSGIYHYHASNINYLNSGYYILKAGSYYGTKGTFTR